MTKKNSASTAPATKQDIAMLMESIGVYYDKTSQWITDLELKFEDHWNASEDRMRQYIDVKFENFSYDLIGVRKDRVEDHEDRIKRLERHTGLLAA